MRRRKEELYAQRREQIINGALQVFATKGFLAATNKAIAEAAQINSPGLIYHYFANKEDLLRAVIEQHAPPLQLLTQGEGLLALPPEQALTQFGMAYLRLMDDPKIGACIRVLIGVMIYTFARVNAATPMKAEEYYTQGWRGWIWLHEKGGMEHYVTR